MSISENPHPFAIFPIIYCCFSPGFLNFFSQLEQAFTIYPLGDAAICLDLGNRIDEAHNNRVLAIRQHLLKDPFTGLRELVIGYGSISIYYDAYIIKKKYQPALVHHWVRRQLEQAYEATENFMPPAGKIHQIPVRYGGDDGPDLEILARNWGKSPEEIIALHCSRKYRVYMIGFLPGFPYLGILPEELHTERKQKPVAVKAGSVAIAGLQTGIYPVDSPGGWHIIGRTDLSLFDINQDPPVWLEPGDYVEFRV